MCTLMIEIFVKKVKYLKSNNTPRSYVVKTDSDIITHNRKHLTAIPSQQIVSCEHSIDVTSLSNERNEPSTFESTNQAADVYVTRYGRTVKKNRPFELQCLVLRMIGIMCLQVLRGM